MNTEELRRVAEAATPGEWQASDRTHVYTQPKLKLVAVTQHGCDSVANAKHIATFNPKTAIELLDKLAALEAENAALREALAAAPQPKDTP